MIGTMHLAFIKIKIDDRNDALGVAEGKESAFHESR
jgi:hypothetical protein